VKARFEIILAVLLGLLLPGLETARRGWDHWSVNFTTMFEDYAAGVALLTAAFAMWRGYRWALAWMIVTWSGISFSLLISTVGQLEAEWRINLEPHSATVLVVKGLLLLASALALWRSVSGSGTARGDHDRDGCP
jgi:hypothetical protein